MDEEIHVEPIIELDRELAEFVETVLTPMFEYRTGGHAWCAEWWKHTEVLNRVQDMCDGWGRIGGDEASLDLNTWYRLYVDHHMPIIMSKENGPLRGCTNLAHKPVLTVQWEHPADELTG